MIGHSLGRMDVFSESPARSGAAGAKHVSTIPTIPTIHPRFMYDFALAGRTETSWP